MGFSASNIDIDDWVEIFEDYIDAKNVILTSSVENIPLQRFYSGWNSEYEGHHNEQITSRKLKLIEREDTGFCDVSSDRTKSLFQRNTEITEKQRLNQPEKNSGPAENPISVPLTKPKAKIINKVRNHSVVYFDESSGRSKDKPEYIKGCEIWYKIGGAKPADESEFQYLSTDTNTPYILRFRGKDSGKTVHYKLRWVNKKNEPGPWSETISAKIKSALSLRFRIDLFIQIFQKLII